MLDREMYNKRLRFEGSLRSEESYFKPDIKSTQVTIDEIIKQSNISAEFKNEFKDQILPLYSCTEEAKKIGNIHSENSTMRQEIKQMK